MTGTVFLIQEPNTDKDLSSAKQFGKIRPIISAEEKPAQNITGVMNKLYAALEDYNYQTDVICFAGGDPLLEFLTGVAVASLALPEITHLIWNRERSPDGSRSGSGFYIPKKIRLIEGNYYDEK